MEGIKVPVSLYIQNLQQLVGELQSKLGNLKVGSAGFKSIQNLIVSIKGEIDKLQVQTSKPFLDQGQFTKAEHSVEKLEDELTKVGITLSRLKFSDLELDSSQKAQLKEFENQINAIKTNLKTVKDTAKQDFLGSAMGEVWKEMDPTAITKSFSQITTNIQSEVSKQQEAVKQAEQALNDYQKAMKANSSIEKFLKIKNPLEETSLGPETYNKIFQETKNGIRFRAGGSTILQDWLKSQLEVDDATLEKLIQGSANTVKTKLAERLKEIQAINQETINKNSNAEVNKNNEEAKFQQLKEIMIQLGASQQTVNAAEEIFRQQLQSTTDAMHGYQDGLVNIARSGENVAGTSQAMRVQLENLKATLQQSNGEFLRMQKVNQSFTQMKTAIVNFMGFNQVLNITKRAVKEALNHIKELDSVMNKISIVTDMSTGDLWKQVDAYSDMAQKYGVSIKGAYEVSQIYYQQGLETKDVMTLTNETLKLAKVSGLDYAQTTDYMTTALRGFKIEMQDAARVVDVYSALAANTAVSQEELAIAMSKTASSMEGVGATFEEASAMIGTMVAVTRESAVNIGSAMKSIASRYGELTKDPTKLVDEDGEAMAFNKVDAALQSVGISMRTVDGQFRDFTDVIVELGEKWEQLDSTQQRYIATQFAGNRQQSRFLALVSNVDLLKANMDVAESSEDTGTLQALKALDSIEAKIEQVRVAYQQFYTTLGAEEAWKGILDGVTQVINTLNGLPKVFGKIPVGAIAIIYDIISLIKNAALHGLSEIASIIVNNVRNSTQELQSAGNETEKAGQNFFDKFIQGMTSRYEAMKAAAAKGVEEAQKAARQQKLDDIDKQEKQNTAQIELNKKKIAEINGNRQQYVNAIGEQDENWQTERFQGLGISSIEEAQQKIESYDASIKELNAANDELIRKNKELEDSFLAETAAENDNSNAKDQNISKTKEGAKAILKYAADNRQLTQATSAVASSLSMISTMIGTATASARVASGVMMTFGGAVRAAGALLEYFNSTEAIAFPWMAVVMGAIGIINGLSMAIESADERAERLAKTAEELSNKAKEEKANYSTLDKSIKKLEELESKRYESAEAAEEYQTAVDELAEKFPQLISGFDEAGNIIVSVQDSESVLTEARRKSAEATYDAAKAELEAARDKNSEAKKTLSEHKGRLDTSIEELLQGRATEADAARYKFLKDRIGPNDIKTKAELESSAVNGKISQQNFDWFANTYGIDVSAFSTTNIDLDEEAAAIEELEQAYAQYKEQNDLTSDSGKQALNRLIGALNSLSEMNIIESGSDIDVMISQIKEDVGNITDLSNIEEGLAKKTIGAWQQLNEASYNYLNESSGAAALVTQAIVDQWKEAGTDKYSLDNENIQIFADRSEAQEKMEAFWNNLSSEQRELFNKMFEDPSNYSAIDFEKEFSAVRGWDDVSDLFTNYYTGVKSLQERLQKNLAERAKVDQEGNYIKQFDNRFDKAIKNTTTEVEAKYLEAILNIEKGIENEGYQYRSAEFGEAALGLFDEVRGIGGEVEKGLWKIIQGSGLNTLEGIRKVQDYIKNNDQIQDKESLTNYLDSMSNTIIPNLNLEIQSATSNLLDTWEDTSKELSAAMSGGVSLKDADKLVQQAQALGLDFDLNKFELVGDKLILIDDAFKEYYEALNASAEAQAEEWTSRLQAAKSFKSFLAGPNGSTTILQDTDLEQMKAIFESINFDYTKYLLGDGTLSVEGIQALEEAITTSQAGLDNYNRAARIAADQLLNSHDRSLGKYKWHADDVDYISDEELKSIASNLHLGKDQIQEVAIKESLNNAYNNLISDVLSKGFKNINLADYEGLINGGEGISLADTSYTKFIDQYVDFTGKTIDEINDLYLQAMEKDQEVSADLIKDLQFINKDTVQANRSQLNDLAKAFDVPLNTLINELNISFDELTGNALVNIADLASKGLDLTSIDGYSTILQDSVKEFFSSIAGAINNAIDGSLGREEARNLSDFAAQYGVSLTFTETTEGLKLATDQAIQLYNIINSLDAIQGQIVFKELMDSLIKTDEHYNSISSTMARIKELQSEIEKADGSVSDARRQEYEKELAVAKEILAVRSTQEDSSFNFMSNKIPAAQNNPLNYAKNLSQAFQVFRDAFDTSKVSKDGKAGFMDYENWYNIVTEFNHMAALSGHEIQLGAYTLRGNMEDAAAAIEGGAANLETVDTGELKVNLGKIGFDVESGSEAMNEGVEAGIEATANAQIEMIDGMIKLLETIVAMEKLGDIDTEGNGIDLSDIIMPILGQTGGNEPEVIGKELTPKYKEWLKLLDEKLANDEELSEAMNSVKIGDKTLIDIAHQTAQEFSESDAAVLNAFYQAAKSGNYDLDDIMTSIREVLAGTGLDEEITIGDMKLRVHAGAVIDVDKDGNYIVNGTNFGNNLDAATKGVYTSNLKTLQDAINQTTNEEGTTTYTLQQGGEVVVDWEAESKTYTATIGNQSVTSTTEEGINAGIATLAKLQNTQLESSDEVTFTLQMEGGRVQAEVTVDTTGLKDPVINFTGNVHPQEEEQLEQKILDNLPQYNTTTVTTDAQTSVVVPTTVQVDVSSATPELIGTLPQLPIPTIDALVSALVLLQGWTNPDESKIVLPTQLNTLITSLEAIVTTLTLTKGSKYSVNEEGVPLPSVLSENLPELKAFINKLKLLMDGNTIKDDTGIELPADYQKEISSVTGVILQLLFGLGAEAQKTAQTGPTATDLGLSTEQYSKEDLIYHQGIQVVYEQTEDNSFNDIRKALMDFNYNPASGIEGRDRELAKLDPLGLDAYYTSILGALGPKKYNLNGTNDLVENAPNLKQYVDYLQNLVQTGQSLGNIDVSNLEKLTQIDLNTEQLQQVKDILASNELLTNNQSPNNAFSGVTDAILAIVGTGASIDEIIKKLETLKQLLTDISTISPSIEIESNAVSMIEAIQAAINKLEGKTVYVKVEETIGTIKRPNEGNLSMQATGNLGLAKAQGTLMGELGPELVVSNGRYFVAGQNGPEMVDLAKDAIVFNHLQTKSLLEKGMSSGRGKTVTNERNAVSFATGNVHGGPAMASAGAALGALRQLRTEWQSLLNLTAKDLAGKGGSGGGGGGNNGQFIKDLEKWYNWLQKIAELESKINYYEAERNRIQSEFNPDGTEYYNSQKKSLQALKEQLATQQDLNKSQEDYFNKRREDMNKNSNPFTSLYTFDENGQLKYKDGALKKLSAISGRDDTGKPNKTDKEQYEAILAMNPEFANYMKYDSSGKEIDQSDYSAMVQAFWDKIDADKEEMQSLHDTVNEGLQKEQELLQAQNEILKEQRDNQMEVENQVYEAIVDMREREIEDQEELRDAIQESTDRFISGLTDALNKERDMYEMQDKESDLRSKQRRLAVLRRTGGSGSEIASLEKDIESSSRDLYFEKQQQEIDAIQEASDLQIERLDQEIEIMREQLEFDKKYGLLWDDVYDVMKEDAATIADFIQHNNSEWWGQSAIKTEETLANAIFNCEQWQAFRDDLDNKADAAKENDAKSDTKEKEAAGKKKPDANTKYQVTYTDSNGKTKTRYFDNKVDAEEFRKQHKGTRSKYQQPETNEETSSDTTNTGTGTNTDTKKKTRWKVGTKSFYTLKAAQDEVEKIARARDRKIAEAETEEEKKKLEQLLTIPKIITEQYEKGGLVDETGPAVLHRHEAVLTADQTSVLRNKILSNKPNSLINLLSEFQATASKMANGSTYNSIDRSAATSIGSIQMNMEVKEIANDYDAKRAGEKAMEEMLRIARKSTVTSLRG